jgi:hypothetical protein
LIVLIEFNTICLGAIQPSLGKRKVLKQLKTHAFHPSCFNSVLFASRASANKTKQQAKLVFKPGPYAGSVEKKIREVSSNPCLRRFVQIFEENLGNKPTSLGEDNGTHFNFSSFPIQA